MEVVQEAAAAADHGEEAAAGGEVLDGLLEVGGKVVDFLALTLVEVSQQQLGRELRMGA